MPYNPLLEAIPNELPSHALQMHMWSPDAAIGVGVFALNDTGNFVEVLRLEVPWAHSYADMRPGKTDRERRENYRNAAQGLLKTIPSNTLWWAFRITVQKAGRALDVDNVAKTIIDSFCASQIARDGSSFSHLGLYPDDTFDHVRVLQVIGNRSAAATSTLVEVFACIQDVPNSVTARRAPPGPPLESK